jgi:hypothetical protein
LGGKGWYFNFNPAEDATALSFNLLSGEGADSVLLGTDAFKADGDGYFDIQFKWSASGDGRFTGGETAVYQITGAGLSAEDFAFLSVDQFCLETTLYSAAHVQGIGLGNNKKSAWIGAKDYALDPNAVVPLPAGVWLLGVGLMGYLGLGRMRRGHGEAV